MIPGAIFKGQRIVALAYAISFVGGMFFYSVLNFVPLTLSNVFPNDPIEIGLRGLAPAISTTISVILFNAALSKFKNHTREVLLTAAVIMTVFGGAMAVTTPNNPRTSVAIATMATFGVGGMIVPPATVALLVAPDALITTIAALSLSVRTVGGAIGYSIYYNVFVGKLTHKLPLSAAQYAIEAGLPPVDAKDFITILLSDPTKITTAPGFSPKILAAAEVGIRWAYAESLHYVWYTSVPFGVCAIVCCMFLPGTAKYQTNRIAVLL